MAADSGRIYVGELDTSVVGRSISLNVPKWTSGSTQYVGRFGFSAGSLACSIKRGIGPGPPQAFSTPLSFSSSNITLAIVAADMASTSTLVWTIDTAGTGVMDVYFIGKSDP